MSGKMRMYGNPSCGGETVFIYVVREGTEGFCNVKSLTFSTLYVSTLAVSEVGTKTSE